MQKIVLGVVRYLFGKFLIVIVQIFGLMVNLYLRSLSQTTAL